jgi:hypothetical protein
MRSFTSCTIVILSACLASCAEGPRPEPMPGELYGPCDASRIYRVTSVDVPVNMDEANGYGLDLDGDGIPDNTLGKINTAITSALSGRESNWAQRAIEDGRLSWYIEVEHCQDELGRYTRVGSHRGLPGGGLDSGGLRAVGVDGTLPHDGEGLFPISAFAELPGNPDNEVRWVRGLGLAADLSETGGQLSGTIGLGITPPDVRGVLLPTFAMGMSRVVSETEGCPTDCPRDSDGWALVELFDDDGDGVITADELAESSLVSALSSPDIDLLGVHDGEAAYWPGHDQRADHMSVGLRIEAEEISQQSF